MELSSPLGTQLFWGVAVPLIPLLLMMFGHAFWRRICPLSTVTRLPRLLGLQRREAVLAPDSWLARNHWQIQFGLLFLALNLRLLLLNSQRTALACFFLGVMAVAAIMGMWFGGKTWCNFLCPIAPVEKVFGLPAGALEKGTASARSPAMCRVPAGPEAGAGDCVACTVPCPDIHPRRYHWLSQGDHGKHLVYYGYFGLVAGFYADYALYSGSWGYYYSGVWTHEPLTAAHWMGPGLFLGGHAIAIPNVMAVPLVLAVAVVAGVLLWGGSGASASGRGAPPPPWTSSATGCS